MRDYKNKTDAELLKLSAKLDERAFEELFLRYERLVYNLVYFKVKKRDDAMDISQEVFLKLWRSAGNYRGDGGVSAFICTIAKNAATDHLRRRGQPMEVPITSMTDDGGEAELPLADTDDTPEEAAVRQGEIEEVRRAISMLPEHYREVLILYDIEGKSYTEISETLSLDMGTVKSRLSRARKSLRDILKTGNKTAP